MWTSHTYKSCAKAPVILILGAWHTEIKPFKKSNPRGWIVADHTQVILDPSPEQLQTFQKGERLFYDKQAVAFSHAAGDCLLFDADGCHTLTSIEANQTPANE